jgi:flagellar protein FlaG
MPIEPVSTGKLPVGTQPVVEQKPRVAELFHGRREEEKKPDVKFLQQVLELAQEHLQARNIGLKFSVHEKTGRIKVTVLDKETGETVREIPPQQVLDLMGKIDEMMGILFDHRV